MNIAIVDDDKLVVEALSSILGSQQDVSVVGCAYDGNGAISLYRNIHPDILLLDVQMRPKDGLAAGREILADDPRARIVYLTTFADEDYIVQALRLGARGYLIKEQAVTIAPALRAIMDGQIVLGDEVIEKFPHVMLQGERDERLATPSISDDPPATILASSSIGPAAIPSLTDREAKIVALIAEGLDNKTIAGALFISEGTVRNHISDILSKLNLKNRTQLAIHYWKSKMKTDNS